MKKLPIWIAIAIVVLGAITAIVYLPHKQTSSPNNTTNATTTTTTLGNGLSVTTQGSSTISLVNTGMQHPSLTGPVIISSSLPSDAASILRTQEQTLISQLAKTPTRLDLWLQLGVDRKIGGDYQGAIQAWNYVAAVGPASISYIAYGNLGDLYMNFDVNYAKAEANYKAAIAANPQVIDYYQSLYILYRYKENNVSAAAAIVAQGLKANPDNQTLLQLQSQLQSGQ